MFARNRVRSAGYTRASQAKVQRSGGNVVRVRTLHAQTAPKPPERSRLVSRAFAAYFRKEGVATAHRYPSRDHSRAESWHGRQYVVLSDGRFVIAVYRVRYDGILRRMKRWPKVITA
jgi:hypothetical protein